MKYRVAAILLAVCVLLCALPLVQAGAAGSLCFIACNETLLTLDSMPYFSGSATYVPCGVLPNFGIYYSYFDTNKALLFTSSTQLFFDLDAGDSYSDADGTHYSAAAVSRNGTVYVPLDYVCGYFGLTWSYISGVGYGDIVRIKNSAVVLTDSEFLNAASTLMQSRYNAYYGIVTTTPAPTPTPEVDHWDTTVYLSFAGLPPKAVLETLEDYGLRGCFFLSAEDILGAPDTVRRLSGEGHAIGLLCGDDPETELPRAQALLFEAARLRTLLAATTGDAALCQAWAAENGLVFCGYAISDTGEDGTPLTADGMTALIDVDAGRADLRLHCGDGAASLLSQILKYLRTNKFSVGDIRETFVNAEETDGGR